MPKYKPFPENTEVMDVFSCIVLGIDTVKQMIKILKLPQSTISTKLQFLLSNEIIKKDRWRFDVNWDNLYKIFYVRMKKQFGLGLISSKKPSKRDKEEMASRQTLLRIDLEECIPKPLVKSILTNYSCLLLDSYPKLSVHEIIDSLLDQLSRHNERWLKNLDKHYNSQLFQLKKFLKYRITEDEFFFHTLVDPTTKEAYGKAVMEDLNKKVK